MSAQTDDMSTVKLMTLLDSVKPVFDDLSTLIAGAKKLQSKYNAQLNYLHLYIKMDHSIKEDFPPTENDLEHRVMHLCEVFNKLGEVMTAISNDDEESQLHLHAGTLDKLQEISQRLSKLIS